MTPGDDMESRLANGEEVLERLSAKGVTDALGDAGDAGHLFGGCAMLMVSDVLICFHRQAGGLGVSCPVPPDEVDLIPPVLGPVTIRLEWDSSLDEIVEAARKQAGNMQWIYDNLGDQPSAAKRKPGDDDRLEVEYDRFYGPRG